MLDLLAAIVQLNADFGPKTRAGDDGSKIESTTVKREITSRHGVDSGPLSEWLALGVLRRTAKPPR
jgi:hypothetical protein